MEDKKIKRRDFIKIAIGTLSLGIPFGIFSVNMPPRCSKEKPESTCLEPVTYEEKCMEALIDTVVPGKKSDPTGAPGALECCALNIAYDRYFPIAAVAPAILESLNLLSKKKYNNDFPSLNLEQRTDVLATLEGEIPQVTLVLRFIRAAFYVGLYNDVGLKYLGYPGPNVGYIHEDYTFGVPMAKELTETGNLP